MLLKNTMFLAILFCMLSFSLNANAIEIDDIIVKSKTGSPIRIDLTIKGNESFSVSEADSDTYKLFKVHRNDYNDRVVIIKDSINNNLFHIKGTKAFHGTVFEIIINFKKDNEDINFYKRIITEISFSSEVISFSKKPFLSHDIPDKKSKKTHSPMVLPSKSKSKSKTKLSLDIANGYVTKSGNTLYGIGLEVSKNIHQDAIIVSSWLFEHNKGAFVKGNPNVIKRFYSLNIPNSNDISSYSINKREARRIIKDGTRKKDFKKKALAHHYKNKLPLYTGKISFSGNKTKADKKEEKVEQKAVDKKMDTVPLQANKIITKTLTKYNEVGIKDIERILNKLETLKDEILFTKKEITTLKNENKKLLILNKISTEKYDFNIFVSLVVNILFFILLLIAILLLLKKKR